MRVLIPGNLEDKASSDAESDRVRKMDAILEKACKQPKPIKEDVGIEYVSSDPVEDARLHKEALDREIIQLKRRLMEYENLPAAIAKAEQERARFIEKEAQVLRDKENERLALLERKQKTQPHGYLIADLKYDTDGSVFFICKDHPGRKIAFWMWDSHVESYELHPDIFANNPITRRRKREELERERASKEKEAETKAAAAERAKADYFARNGFVKA